MSTVPVEAMTIAKAAVANIERDFSSKDHDAWLSNFIPGPVTACQVGESGTTSFTVHNGSTWEALTSFTPPAKIMAVKIFGDLAKKDYDKSEMAVLAVKHVSDEEVLTVASAKRLDTSGAIFQTLGVVYALDRVGEQWLIRQLWAWDTPEPPPELAEELQLSTFDWVAKDSEYSYMKDPE